MVTRGGTPSPGQRIARMGARTILAGSRVPEPLSAIRPPPPGAHPTPRTARHPPTPLTTLGSKRGHSSDRPQHPPQGCEAMAPLGIDTRGGGPDPGPASPGAVRYTARSLRLGRPWTAQGDDVRPPPQWTRRDATRSPCPACKGNEMRAAARAPRPPGGVMTSRDVMAGPGIRRWHGSRVQAGEASGGPARDLQRRGWREATPRLRSRPASRSDPLLPRGGRRPPAGPGTAAASHPPHAPPS